MFSVSKENEDYCVENNTVWKAVITWSWDYCSLLKWWTSELSPCTRTYL